MVNHVRTLVLNLPAGPPGPGEEYIPPAFVPPVLPAELAAARDALLGPGADRPAAVLQVARLLAYLHTSALAADVTLADPRLTYDPARPAGTTAGLLVPPAYGFATAAAGFPGADAVFQPARSAAETRWADVWDSNNPAPLRASALALALAARVNDLLTGTG